MAIQTGQHRMMLRGPGSRPCRRVPAPQRILPRCTLDPAAPPRRATAAGELCSALSGVSVLGYSDGGIRLRLLTAFPTVAVGPGADIRNLPCRTASHEAAVGLDGAMRVTHVTLDPPGVPLPPALAGMTLPEAVGAESDGEGGGEGWPSAAGFAAGHTLGRGVRRVTLEAAPGGAALSSHRIQPAHCPSMARLPRCPPPCRFRWS